jgi:hypothetical protein
MPKYNLIALTNAVEGQDEAFNDWYTNVHLADVLKLPGVMAAQRFRMSDTQHRPGPFEFGYMAVYEIEIDDVRTTLQELKKVSGTAKMPLSPALQDSRMVWIMEPITGRIERPKE